MSTTFYWHDYETFGVDPSVDRPSQFAGLRTDENLNPIGEPLVIYCQPQKDILPAPIACLVTPPTCSGARPARAGVYRSDSPAAGGAGNLWCRL